MEMDKEKKTTFIMEIDFMNLWGYNEEFGFYWSGEDPEGNFFKSSVYEDVNAAKEDFASMMEQRGYKIKMEKIKN